MKSLLSGVTSFAHLAGGRALAPAAAKKAEDDEEDMKTDPQEPGAEEKEVKPKGEDDEDDTDAKAKAKKAKKARKAKRREDDEDDDDDDDDDDEGDDDDDREDAARVSGDPVRAARRRERARCAAIFADPAAAANPPLAARLAFGTDLGRDEAVAVLRDGAPVRAGGLASRMAGQALPPLGPDSAPASEASAKDVAARIIKNYEAGKRRP